MIRVDDSYYDSDGYPMHLILQCLVAMDGILYIQQSI
jgi:hypothetical protein